MATDSIEQRIDQRLSHWFESSAQALLFLFILALEESGYLPRAAFLLDRVMADLHGPQTLLAQGLLPLPLHARVFGPGHVGGGAHIAATHALIDVEALPVGRELDHLCSLRFREEELVYLRGLRCERAVLVDRAGMVRGVDRRRQGLGGHRAGFGGAFARGEVIT